MIKNIKLVLSHIAFLVFGLTLMYVYLHANQDIAPSSKAATRDNQTHSNHDALSSIKIEGTKEFNEQVIKALKLLKDKTPDDYARVGKYVTSIEYTPKTDPGGLMAYVRPSEEYGRIFVVTMPTDLVLYNMAGIIVHESRHLEQYHTNHNMQNDHKKLEEDAINTEFRAYQKIGVPKDIIENGLKTKLNAISGEGWRYKKLYNPPPS